ncbi:hypothetical protein TPHV1_190049 [Treponema phagedenis]|uniref:Uncharacterized protein n=1 Tax=Treponema phagedenis TaxID=162 RepID=A0A0B7GV40_TREPH|nr:hypothetical protein TPHV1_190049 [Treponema phagedenis]
MSQTKIEHKKYVRIKLKYIPQSFEKVIYAE